MPIEVEVSDMLSRVIERTRPSVEIVSDRVRFEFQGQNTVTLSVDGHKTVYQAEDIRKEGFFREHSIPNASRWVLNRNPNRNIFEVFVKRQIVYTPEPASELVTQSQA